MGEERLLEGFGPPPALARRDIKDRVEIEAAVHKRITDSIRSTDWRTTVRRPESAARYAANALLCHEPKLLAAAAVLFARPEVETLLARTEERTDG